MEGWRGEAGREGDQEVHGKSHILSHFFLELVPSVLHMPGKHPASMVYL